MRGMGYFMRTTTSKTILHLIVSTLLNRLSFSEKFRSLSFWTIKYFNYIFEIRKYQSWTSAATATPNPLLCQASNPSVMPTVLHFQKAYVLVAGNKSDRINPSSSLWRKPRSDPGKMLTIGRHWRDGRRRERNIGGRERKRWAGWRVGMWFLGFVGSYLKGNNGVRGWDEYMTGGF